MAPDADNIDPEATAKDAETIFNRVLASDPDPVKKNSQWLLTQILRKTNPMPLEDLDGAAETLTRYAEMKKARQIPPDRADINAFKSLSELAALLRGEETRQVAASDTEQQAMLDQSEVLLDDATILLLIPKTQKPPATGAARPTGAPPGATILRRPEPAGPLPDTHQLFRYLPQAGTAVRGAGEGQQHVLATAFPSRASSWTPRTGHFRWSIW